MPDSTVIKIVGPECLFGELDFFAGTTRISTAVTLEESMVFALHCDELFRLMQYDSSLGHSILLNIVEEFATNLCELTYKATSEM